MLTKYILLRSWIAVVLVQPTDVHPFASGQNLQAAMNQQQQAGPVNPLSSDKFQRSIIEGDFEFLKFLPYDELTMRMAGMFGKIFQDIQAYFTLIGLFN